VSNLLCTLSVACSIGAKLHTRQVMLPRVLGRKVGVCGPHSCRSAGVFCDTLSPRALVGCLDHTPGPFARWFRKCTGGADPAIVLCCYRNVLHFATFRVLPRI